MRVVRNKDVRDGVHDDWCNEPPDLDKSHDH